MIHKIRKNAQMKSMLSDDDDKENGKEVFKKDGVDRNRIFANVNIKQKLIVVIL